MDLWFKLFEKSCKMGHPSEGALAALAKSLRKFDLKLWAYKRTLELTWSKGGLKGQNNLILWNNF